MRMTWLDNAIIAIIFLMPLSLLVYVQITNIWNNSTTNLRFSKRKHDTLDEMTEYMADKFLDMDHRITTNYEKSIKDRGWSR